MKLLLVGATGLVGRHVLEQALADSRIHAVIAPVRRPLPEHPKLSVSIVDFDHLPAAADWWAADAVICTLGTTMKAAGSKEAFRRVDHGYVLACARHARTHGTPTFVLNSAMGANSKSLFFYSRVKGELEEQLAEEGFASLTFVRPGLIGGEREHTRPAEHYAAILFRFLHPILPRAWRINPAPRIAAKLIEAARTAPPGRHAIRSADLT